jgi:hypothetical protein
MLQLLGALGQMQRERRTSQERGHPSTIGDKPRVAYQVGCKSGNTSMKTLTYFKTASA